MVKHAATSTDIRKRRIMDLVKDIKYNRVETIRQFGITVGEEFIQVESHIMNPPSLEYGNKKILKPQDGVWRAEGVSLLRPNECLKWGILNTNFRTRENDIDNLGHLFVKTARGGGLNFADYNRNLCEKLTDRYLDKRKLDDIMNRYKKADVKLVFVIIPGSGDNYYDIKKSAEQRCGILTQCLKEGTLGRLDGSTLNNILLKVNSKLGGTNQRIIPQIDISITKRPYMLIGADVTHPSPEQQRIPSVVGVAASYDFHGFRYNCQWRIQSPREEMIQDLEEIVLHHLNFFKNANKDKLPQHILYYRDGVSDGQFEKVRSIELNAIFRACGKIAPNYKPKVTFIVVQKRHHTRFFPTKPNPMDRKNNNVNPGTVVDSEIVDPNKWQFFLVAHKSIQGVAKPTKYCVLFDDSMISNEELQHFTYNLCHLFTRCNRTVSYVAPTYYAHLVAYRGRVYIHQ